MMREEEFNKSGTEGFSKEEENRGGDERRYQRRDRRPSFSKKQCYFKKNGIREIDFKDIGLLRRFVGKSGKMLPKKFTGVSPRAQRVLAIAIKRARYMALLPYTGEMGYLDFNLPKRVREPREGEYRDYRSEERFSYRPEEREVKNDGPAEASSEV